MRDRSTAQTLAMLFGVVFLAVGILGFIPGITSNYDELKFAGEDSQAELLGLFQVSILHNIVHALFGIAGLALARTVDGARTYLLASGVIYAVLWILGLIGGLEWLPTNTEDHWLHFGLALAFLGAWYVARRDRDVATRAAT